MISSTVIEPPEGTAPAVRAYIEHAVLNQEPLTRWYYIGPMFRYERMKTGRYRSFSQIGVEAFGAKEPAQDVEVIEMDEPTEATFTRFYAQALTWDGSDPVRPFP